MERKRTHRIRSVEKGSPAELYGISEGEIVLSINSHELKDIFDYHYYSDDANVSIELVGNDGARRVVNIEKDVGEDLGLSFENGLLDEYRSCSNSCIFCFIDQNPKGMRDTIYFKDDDTRLSFLQGNYVTLTNMKDEDLDRVISYRLAPINVSVHTTDPDVRCMMLRNRFAGDIMRKLKKIKDALLPMNGQIVLCKGINDGDVLLKTLRDLKTLYPEMGSVSVVPVGLSMHREGLYPLLPFEKEDSRNVLSLIDSFNRECRQELGVGFVYASDEWYMKAELPLPEADYYDGYPQIENGVGMLRSFWDEFEAALSTKKRPFFKKRTRCSVVSGVMSGSAVKKMCEAFNERFKKDELIHHTIINHFYGESVTVTGLITGGDLIEQLRGRNLGDKLMLPSNMFRAGEEVFLDDVTRADVEAALGVPVVIVPADGCSLIDEMWR